ncbi:MAG: hypothetical protein ACRDYB_05375 [Acidimicrobiales bacterium]
MSTSSIAGSMGVPARSDIGALARRLVVPGIGAGLLGGLLYIVVMILVMGTSGMGYASPLNLGMPAFVFVITPPLAMFPMLMTMMGITLPAPVMGQLAGAIHSGHIPAAMVSKLGPMLMSMHVPAAKVHMIGALMTGHATNSTVATLMSQLPPHARNAVMAAMPVSAGHVVVGVVLHFAFSAFLGVLFFAIIAGAAWFLPALRNPMALMAAGVIGGAIVYVINRWALLPPTNPMMALVPQIAFFLSHLLFGLVVGTGLAMVLRRSDVRRLLPA